MKIHHQQYIDSNVARTDQQEFSPKEGKSFRFNRKISSDTNGQSYFKPLENKFYDYKIKLKPDSIQILNNDSIVNKIGTNKELSQKKLRLMLIEFYDYRNKHQNQDNLSFKNFLLERRYAPIIRRMNFLTTGVVGGIAPGIGKTPFIGNEILSNVDFSGCTFEKCNLSQVRMDNASFNNAKFSHCFLSGTIFSGSNFTNSSFIDCDFTGAQFNESILEAGR